MKGTLALLTVVLLSFITGSEAKSCSHHPFEISELRGRVSKSLSAKGVNKIEILPENESQSKSLILNPAVKRVVIAKTDIDRNGRFAFEKLNPGLYWVMLLPSRYHFAIRIRRQAVQNVELQIDEENGCTIVDFLKLK